MDPLLNEIVGLLRVKRGAGLSPERLAESLGIAQSRTLSALDELRALGYELSVADSGTVRIARAPDRLIDTEILSGLKTRVFARQLHCYKRITSTNTRAFQLAEHGAPEGTMVVAEEQTGGRGRMGRSWHSPPGLGLWFSLALRPQVPLQRASGLSLLAALAFAQTVKRELSLPVQLKWPNDGLIDGRKVLGILTEVSAEVDRIYFVICGIGINVNHQPDDFPQSLREVATSLAIACGQPVDRLALCRDFLSRFERLYQEFCRSGITRFLDEYRSHSVLLGREVVVHQGRDTIAGRAVDIDDSGALVVRQGRRDTIVYAGEATLRDR